MSDFAQAMTNVAEFKTAEDVVHFLRNPNDYQQYYMIWLELSRPMDMTHETFGLFAKSVAEREKKEDSGKQTEDTGD